MPKYKLPLSSLPAFEAVARHQSIIKAARELYLDRAAVSRHILRLEQSLGRHLFARRHRSIVLTEDGQTLFGAVEIGFSQIQRALTQLSGRHNPERLVISVDPDFAGLWLVPRLAEFYAIVPNTLVELLVERGGPSEDNPRINCAIHYIEADANLGHGEMLFRSRLFPVCARGLMERNPLSSPDDLRHHVLLHDRSPLEWQEYLRGRRLKPAIDANLGIIFGETALCLDAAAREQGVAIGDDFLAAMLLADGRLIKPFRSSVFSQNAYVFVVPTGAAQHPDVDKLRIWLMRGIERHRKALRGSRR